MTHFKNGDTAGDSHAPKNTPLAGETAQGATKFQQSKHILEHAIHRMSAIFFMRVLCLGDLLPLIAAVLVLLAVEASK